MIIISKNILITIIVALVVGAGAFYGGIKYQQSKQTSRLPGFREGGNGQTMLRTGNQNGNGSGFQPVNGEIISSDENSITVKMQDGSSKIVLLSDSTSVNKAETGSKEDLKSGEKVFVMGNINSDGSISATSIQLNPQDRPGFVQEQ